MQWWFKKSCKGDESLEYEQHSGWPLEADNDQLSGLSELILLQLHKKWLKNSMPILLSGEPFPFEANWKGEKTPQVGASWADWKSKKSSFWSVIFSYSTQQQQTISRLDCDMSQKVDFMAESEEELKSLLMKVKKLA